MMYSLGMLIGPPAIGFGLDAFAFRNSADGAPLVMAAFFGFYLLALIVERIRRKPS